MAKCVPPGTSKANNWAMSVWEKWARDRNRVAKTRQDLYYPIPVDLTGEPVTVDKLDYWMSFFVMEARRQDGACYPPNSLLNIVAGVQRYLRNVPQFADVAFFQKKSSPFSRLRKALDCRMKELTSAGIGVSVKRADDECALWNSGVMNISTSKGLSYAVF